MRAPVVIAGHSHTVALGVPISSPDGLTDFVALSGEPRATGLTGAFPRTDEYWADMVALTKVRTVAISWNGNQHLAGLLVAQPFDFALRSRPDLPVAPITIVPELAVRELLGQSHVTLTRVLEGAARAGGRPPIILGTPPPKGDAAWVRRRLSSEVHFVQLAEQAGVSLETIELSTPQVWLKSWLVIQELLREIAGAFSLRFCPSPPDAQTADGFLREEYWSDDVTHANAAYGMLMRRDLDVVHASV
jgi:hypothetical protein